MRSAIVFILSAVTVACAEVSGEAVFETHCASCHVRYVPQLALKANYERNNTVLKLKAPTLTELSFRIKDQVGDRKSDKESQLFEIENWLEEFLKNPSAQQRSILPPDVRKHFGKMPPVRLNEEEREALAEFLYDYAEAMMIKHGVKRYSYEEAFKKAKAEGKLVIIEGYLPYCRWCIRMDREVMVETPVKDYLNRHFVFVKMNLATEKLPLGMRRLGTPSFYFIDPRRNKVIDMVEGYGDVEAFLQLLKDIVAAAS